jgi:hypothetical protein
MRPIQFFRTSETYAQLFELLRQAGKVHHVTQVRICHPEYVTDTERNAHESSFRLRSATRGHSPLAYGNRQADDDSRYPLNVPLN